MIEFPQIVTFYSFKGGVGRSMAVLNSAYALAAKGRNVLVLDMDLEAPGLSGFLRRHDEMEKVKRQDMVDLVRWARDLPSIADLSEESPDPASFPPLSDFAVAVDPEKFDRLQPELGEPGRIDVIPVDEERDYYGRLTALDVGSFDRDTLVSTANSLRAYLKSRQISLDVPDYYGPDAPRAAPYDYVLVDSRTGVTETGGLCIGPLSDSLVVLTALNDQNVEGTRRFLEEVGVLAHHPQSERSADKTETEPPHRLDPKPILIVASPVPAGELEQKRARLQKLEQAIGRVVVKLSYHPQMALLESIFVRDYQDEYLAQEYDRLTYEILKLVGDGTKFDTSRLFASTTGSSREERHAVIQDAIRYAMTFGTRAEGVLDFILHGRFKFSPANDEDLILADRLHRLLSTSGGEDRFQETTNWAGFLAEWSCDTTDAELKALRRDAALTCFAKVLDSDQAADNYRAQAFFNRGVTFGKYGELEKEIADYTAVVEMADAPAEQKAKALYNRGNRYGKLDESEKAIADYTAVVEMADASAEQKAMAHVNRGNRYGELDGSEKAIADYTAVVEMADAPADQKAHALSNRGWARYLSGEFTRAMDDYREAISIQPDDCTARGNLAVALLVVGEIDSALEEYDRALALAKLKKLSEMEEDLKEALQKHGELPGADHFSARIAKRREELESESGDDE